MGISSIQLSMASVINDEQGPRAVMLGLLVQLFKFEKQLFHLLPRAIFQDDDVFFWNGQDSEGLFHSLFVFFNIFKALELGLAVILVQDQDAVNRFGSIMLCFFTLNFITGLSVDFESFLGKFKTYLAVVLWISLG